jgi:hypothetical protein
MKLRIIAAIVALAFIGSFAFAKPPAVEKNRINNPKTEQVRKEIKEVKKESKIEKKEDKKHKKEAKKHA